MRRYLIVLIATLAIAPAAFLIAQSQGAKPVLSGPRLAPLPPLPAPGFAPARPLDVTRRAYEFAARNPEVIKYVPCYCGCENHGHRSNESCFVRSRDDKGGVTWEPHGFGCAVCIDVAVEAARMHAAGADPVSIRAAIERNWTSKYPTKTPTPHPPAKKH